MCISSFSWNISSVRRSTKERLLSSRWNFFPDSGHSRVIVNNRITDVNIFEMPQSKSALELKLLKITERERNLIPTSDDT
jgi:hypothetical protein